MEVYDAVTNRRSVRRFLDRPVDRRQLQRILDAACRSPSGGNLQPWHLFALTGEPLDRLKKTVAERISNGEVQDEPEYPMYPVGLTSPYRDRRFRNGEQLYAALGIPREDKSARRRQFGMNFELFGAPVGLFCYVHRQMGSAQWSDLGMYLQTVMLLLHAEGLASCPQESWSLHYSAVDEVVARPEELMLFCGMAIGYEDTAHPVNTLRTERTPLSEVAMFLGWGDSVDL
ncbi:nitroreductase [Nocardia sp. NPDC059240]|uniref:nitroreductase n=1 Tax=Nocardia sp. NPDC059240 TaxID=3346786 RepID=UPI0036C0367B